MSEPTSLPAENGLDADLSGRQLSGYRLLRRLGQGAMAEVYLAEQVSLGRQVAVKVLRGTLANDATYVERFQQEARAAAQLIHANIVQIYEVGCDGGVHYIAQEYIQGMNLAEWMARRGQPELPRLLTIVRQVAAALSKAAEHGIVHRDIKPENIMLAAGGEVKVADFGLARLYNADTASNLTQVGVTMGTPLYMSPEQVEGKPLDARSDVYSLGITAYEMLAGEPPFRGETALAIAVQHLHTPPEPLEKLRPDVPRAVCRIVHHMLEKDAQKRYATPRQLLGELRAVSVELFQEDPGEPIDTWDNALPAGTDERRQATERLAEAMRTTAMPAVGRKNLRRFALGLLACAALGIATSWVLRPRQMISAATEDPTAIPKHATPAEQLIYATMLDSEPGWMSVAYYFPGDKLHARRAKQGLALLYLREYDYARARQVFDEFAAFNDAEVQFRAFGLAGQAIVLVRQDRFQEAAERLTALLPIRDALDGEMRALVGIVLSDRRLPGDGSFREWRQWSRNAPPPGPRDARAAAEPPAG